MTLNIFFSLRKFCVSSCKAFIITLFVTMSSSHAAHSTAQKDVIAAQILEQIKSGVRDFSGRELSGVNLSGADLNSLNFRGSKLDAANLSGANLRGAEFQGASLQKPIWTWRFSAVLIWQARI